MRSRGYGQYCGLARALEVVGERWSLLVIRDLLVRPRRFSELRRGLPRIPTNVLSARLRELEEAGVVRRRLVPRPGTGFEYELTEYGRELEEAVAALGRWGARELGKPRPDEVLTPEALVMTLRAAFQPARACGFSGSYELRVGEAVVHARIADGALHAAPGPLPGADLAIEAGPVLGELLRGELTPAAALRSGAVRLKGKKALFAAFVGCFRIGPAPSHPPAA
jgi:DNA-binding HxlR family transcriptional regulator/putative sterol carrier protein